MKATLRNNLILGVSGALAIVLIAGLAWWVSIERLPGYNTEPDHRMEYVEPDGSVSEYLTGTVTNVYMSPLGPKITMRLDLDNSQRVFYLNAGTPVWVGLTIGDKTITGKETADAADITKGQRIAVFIGKSNTAKRLHILVRDTDE